MTALVACLLVASDGRTARVVTGLIADRGGARFVLSAVAAAILGNVAASALGGTFANAALGQGVLVLFQGIALIAAAIGLVWTRRAPARLAAVPGPAWPALAVALGLFFFGDASQFLIFTLAATSGAGHWAALGGLVGIGVGLLPALALGDEVYAMSAMRWVRWIAAALLALAGIRAVLTAFGLIG